MWLKVAKEAMNILPQLKMAAEQAATVLICAQTKEEISQLDGEEAEMFLADGLNMGLGSLIRAGWPLRLERYFIVIWKRRNGPFVPDHIPLAASITILIRIIPETVAYDDDIACTAKDKHDAGNYVSRQTYVVR